jgi:hypothetical protein
LTIAFGPVFLFSGIIFLVSGVPYFIVLITGRRRLFIERIVLSSLVIWVLSLVGIVGVAITEPPTAEQAATAEQAKADKAAEERRCAADLKCIAEKNISYASVRCNGQIERLAKNDFQWTDRWYERKFDRYHAKKDDNSVITYAGDKIKFQNGFGAWIWHMYFCDYDVKNDRVLDVRAQPGRFPDN